MSNNNLMANVIALILFQYFKGLNLFIIITIHLYKENFLFFEFFIFRLKTDIIMTS